MRHVDPEDLALVALGEPVDAATREHLDACPECAATVASFADVVGVARGIGPDDVLVAPPERVWAAISEELALSGPASGAGTRAAPGAEDAASADQVAPSAQVVPLRRRGLPWLAAAAAAGVVVGSVGTGLLLNRPEPAPTTLARAALDPLPGWEASGDAQVLERADGTVELVVTLDGPAADGDFREVWLIDREVTRLVSLGVLEGSSGTFTVPTGLDLADFAVVDISAEPFDGDPAHSGDSIIRGVLDT